MVIALEGERRHGMEEVVERLSRIETRLSRIEGGLMLGAFLLGIAVPIVLAVVHL